MVIIISAVMDIDYVLIGVSYILAIAAAHLSFKNWERWQGIEFDTIKARIFLDKSFLIDNFRLTFISIGVMVGLTSVFLILAYSGVYGLSQKLYLLHFSVFPLAIMCLIQVVNSYRWYRLLHKKKFREIRILRRQKDR